MRTDNITEHRLILAKKKHPLATHHWDKAMLTQKMSISNNRKI